MENTAIAILASLLKQPGWATKIEDEIEGLPKASREKFIHRLLQLPDLPIDEIANGSKGNGYFPGLMSADYLLTTTFPEPKWIVPGIIPAGLTVLGGAPKMGKSFLSLQLMLSVVTGGMFLGRKVERRPCLYLALEDPPSRLQERMRNMNWPLESPADFFSVFTVREIIKDFNSEGANHLAQIIENKGYEMVIIDTLSKVFKGDKNEEQEMMAFVSPLQIMAQEQEIGLVLVHHHGKMMNKDVVKDLMGSTALGGAADTILGVYRERNSVGAELSMTGRSVTEKTIKIRFDPKTMCWQPDDNPLAGLTPEQSDVIVTLEQIGSATLREIIEALGKIWPDERGKIYNRLVGLEDKRRVYHEGDKWKLS